MEEIKDFRNSKINILITENREQRGKKFTEYIYSITTPTGHEYTIARRFSEFYSLYEILVHNFQIQFPFPPKKLNKLNGNIIELRKKALQDFLKFLINHPLVSIRKSEDLMRFLDQNTASFNNKLTKEKITFEQVNEKKKTIKLELSIVEGKEFKLQKRSMWDIVSFCVFEIGHEPNIEDNPKTSKKTPIIAGPYPRWSFKSKISIKPSEQNKTLYFKIYNQEPTTSPTTTTTTTTTTDDGNNSSNNSNNSYNSNSNHNSYNNINSNIKDSKIELIGSCFIDIEKLSINNQSPTLHVLHLEPEGSGEILISLLLL